MSARSYCTHVALVLHLLVFAYVPSCPGVCARASMSTIPLILSSILQNREHTVRKRLEPMLENADARELDKYREGPVTYVQGQDTRRVM